MEDIVADSIWRPRFSAWLFSILGGLALALTAAGIYGVIAYTMSLRTREVGIRVALGATPAHVVGLVLRGAFAPLLAGLFAGIVAAILSSRALTTLLYEIHAGDPVTYLAAGCVLLGIGFLAAVRPALKAAHSDPLDALRTD